MLETNQIISLQFKQEEIYLNLEVSDNFNTENPLFEEVAFYLGAIEHHHQKDSASIHLTTLEKLEILCKKAREYADQESDYTDDYQEIKVVVVNNNYSLDYPISLATEYDNIKLITNNLLLVNRDSLFGVVDTVGKEIVPILFEEVFLLNDSIIQAKSNGIVSLYSTDGILKHAGLEDVRENFNPFGAIQDYYWFKKQGKWGLFDHKLNQIIPYRLEYDSCELVSNNTQQNIYIKVTKDGKCGLINGLLNVEVISLDREIENIVLTAKAYLVTKKNNQQITVAKEDLIIIEEKIKFQN